MWLWKVLGLRLCLAVVVGGFEVVVDGFGFEVGGYGFENM